MEDRIAILEQNVKALEDALDACNARRVALSRALTTICGSLLASAGLSPDQIRHTGDVISSNALFSTIDGIAPEDSDRVTSLVSSELGEFMNHLAQAAEAHGSQHQDGSRREGSVSLSASQVQADALRELSASAAIAECESFRNLCEHNADCETDPAIKAALFQISLYARTRAVALKSSLQHG